MHAFIQSIMVWYFNILDQFGLLGVVVLMAMESSIFPVPSEMVVPPAAAVYMRDVHRDGAILLVIAVILAGTLGSFIGAAVTYYVSRWLGRPLVIKYGKYVLITETKLKHADEWMVRYGAGGIFIARLLPVVRHVISIPAGIIGMRFRTFATMTILGSFIWCTVLAVFGVMMSGEMLTIIAHHGQYASPVEEQAVSMAVNKLTLATLALVGVAMCCYWLLARKRKSVASQPSTPSALSGVSDSLD